MKTLFACFSALLLSFGAAQVCEPGFKRVSHAVGETCVPQNPERIVALDGSSLDHLLAMGVTPVGAAFSGNRQVADYGSFDPEIQERVAEVTVVGQTTQPNLETILSLQPDLILGNAGWHGELYDKLSAVAPTVFTEEVITWKENLELHGEALGLEEEAAALRAAYDARVSALRSALGDRLQDEVSLVRIHPDTVRLYGVQSFGGEILADVGFARPESQRNLEESYRNISTELLPQADGDVLIYFQDNPDESLLPQLEAVGLWPGLRAVQNENAHEVAFRTWLGTSYLDAMQALDDLAAMYGVTE